MVGGSILISNLVSEIGYAPEPYGDYRFHSMRIQKTGLCWKAMNDSDREHCYLFSTLLSSMVELVQTAQKIRIILVFQENFPISAVLAESVQLHQ
jgi:hypothetical protein